MNPATLGRKDIMLDLDVMGAIYYDPILMENFNETVFIFNF